jgi:hypothetical protein
MQCSSSRAPAAELQQQRPPPPALPRSVTCQLPGRCSLEASPRFSTSPPQQARGAAVFHPSNNAAKGSRAQWGCSPPQRAFHNTLKLLKSQQHEQLQLQHVPQETAAAGGAKLQNHCACAIHAESASQACMAKAAQGVSGHSVTKTGCQSHTCTAQTTPPMRSTCCPAKRQQQQQHRHIHLVSSTAQYKCNTVL